MDEYVYNSLSHYFNALGKIGYYKQADVNKLLILTFYNNFINNDFRGYITQDDYMLIDQALNCLYGSSCLIPYPNYLQMGELHLGDLSEVVTRIKNIENTKVVKVKEDITEIPDIVIGDNTQDGNSGTIGDIGGNQNAGDVSAGDSHEFHSPIDDGNSSISLP